MQFFATIQTGAEALLALTLGKIQEHALALFAAAFGATLAAAALAPIIGAFWLGWRFGFLPGPAASGESLLRFAAAMIFLAALVGGITGTIAASESIQRRLRRMLDWFVERPLEMALTLVTSSGAGYIIGLGLDHEASIGSAAGEIVTRMPWLYVAACLMNGDPIGGVTYLPATLLPGAMAAVGAAFWALYWFAPSLVRRAADTKAEWLVRG